VAKHHMKVVTLSLRTGQTLIRPTWKQCFFTLR